MIRRGRLLSPHLSQLACPTLRQTPWIFQRGSDRYSFNYLLGVLPLRAAATRKIDATKDYYKELGLSKGASEQEIKKSFYELAKKFHPDSTEGQSDALKRTYEERVKIISAAYEILSSPELKAQYDAQRGGSSSNGGQQGYQAEQAWSYKYDANGRKYKVYDDGSTSRSSGAKTWDSGRSHYSS